MTEAATASLSARRGGPLRGRVRPPGDKSISHRAFLFGLLTRGTVEIDGALEGEDVLRTGEACQALGAEVVAPRTGRWTVQGPDSARCSRRATTLDFGNAGTGSRLMMGIVGSHPIEATFDGDASLRKRPMRRILDPLRQMGAEVDRRGRGRPLSDRAQGPGVRVADRLPHARGLRPDQIRRAARRA